MKNFSILTLLLLSFFSFSQIGIGTISPNISAQLDVTSTAKGLLPPRMTNQQKNAIVSTAAGLIVWCTNCGPNGELQVFNGTAWTNVSGANASIPSTTIVGGNAFCDNEHQTQVVDIVSPNTGTTWMDRNMGASRAATSSNDYLAYGCLYQWGRNNDGHASINWTSSTAGTPVNGITSTLSTTSIPGNNLFIVGASDWRNVPDNSIWTTTGQTNNNPCPSGYSVPTLAQFTAEIRSINDVYISNSASAFNQLKFVVAGDRSSANGSLNGAGSYGAYWTRDKLNELSTSQGFFNTAASDYDSARNFGSSVRCIKN